MMLYILTFLCVPNSECGMGVSNYGFTSNKYHHLFCVADNMYLNGATLPFGVILPSTPFPLIIGIFPKKFG